MHRGHQRKPIVTIATKVREASMHAVSIMRAVKCFAGSSHNIQKGAVIQHLAVFFYLRFTLFDPGELTTRLLRKALWSN